MTPEIFVLSREDQELIDRGLEAEKVLQSRVFKEAVNALFKSYSERLLSSGPEEQDERERLYYQHRALQDVVLQLGEFYARSELLLRELAEQEISE